MRNFDQSKKKYTLKANFPEILIVIESALYEGEIVARIHAQNYT